MSFQRLIGPASQKKAETAFCFMRVGIGLIMFGLGIPKIMLGIEMWKHLGMFMQPLGIYFMPTMWGFLGACTECFGGLLLASGFLTRIASAALTIMMFVAWVWHLDRGDGFNLVAFPLSLFFVFIMFAVVGAGKYSVDAYLGKKK